MREADRELCLDAAGTGAHDDDAAAEEDGFLDIVGNEQHGLLVALSDAEQHFLHQHARLIVERTEGLIEQEDLWVIGKRTRDRGRCSMPPDGCFGQRLSKPDPTLDEPSAILVGSRARVGSAMADVRPRSERSTLRAMLCLSVRSIR